MKKIIESLEKQRSKLEEIVQKREDYVDERSEKWQESEACEEYIYKTEDIEGSIEDLDHVIDNLKELQN